MSQNQNQKGLLLAGDLFVAFEDANGVMGNFHQYECDKLEVTTPSEWKEKNSKSRTNYGQPFISIPKPEPAVFAVTFSEVDQRIFAAQLSGVIVPIDEAASTFAGESVTAALGEWVQLPAQNIAEAGFVVTDDDAVDPTPYAEGVDYLVNRRLGLLQALPGGGITQGEALKVTGAGQATGGTRILGARRYKTVMHVRLDGLNLNDNRDIYFESRRAVVTSDQAYDFLQEEVSEAQLSGKMELPAPGQPPFILEYRTSI